MDLTDADHVVLEPRLELIENAEQPGELFLLHLIRQSALLLPAGVRDLLDSLRSPRTVADLVEEYEDERLVRLILSNLVAQGAAYVLGPRDALEPALLAEGRSRWERSFGPQLLEAVLRCDRLEEVAPRLETVAPGLRVRTPNGDAAPELVARLFRRGTTVEITGWPWPHPNADPPWLERLIAGRVSVVAVLRADVPPDDDGIAACVAWIRRRRITGLRVELGSEPTEDSIDAWDRAAVLLEQRLADARLDGLPDDSSVAGERRPERPELGLEPGPRSALLVRHLRRRALHLRSLEKKISWATIPEAESYWVDPEQDLLPSHPQLLGLGNGAVLADVGGGLGRVARRLAPHVGPEGLVVSVEKEGILVDRARRFARELGFENVEFRPGLGQQLPLADGSVDAVVIEWAGWMLSEDAADQVLAEAVRVLRTGGRVAVNQMLCQLRLRALSEVRVDHPNAFTALERAFQNPQLELLERRFWGQSQRLEGKPISWLQARFLPRLLESATSARFPELDEPTADVYLTMIARKLG